jgi:N-dimethylarginine dimethylaminohydrolase
MSAPLRRVLLRRPSVTGGFAAAGEYQTMGCNVLAVGPGRVVMLNGNPRTRAALESAGCEVHG